ncbi:HNH endonuclease signature motif containing protein [Pseudomonas sichuanensis]|uniref:HNH endonuclease signature motif containing protein n=1 Tax=Pseudomonas sichuanensis TaxID=2213015 RepID=UPI002ACB16B0|nr:HNH endonuclease signature motif containing protein [Pseudomonas sichuanensis]
MRQFERDDEGRAATGDVDAQLRAQRRKEVLGWNANKRRAALKNATPSWADHAAIDAFYTDARRLTAETGVMHEVDHIVPLQGRRVCGLHVEANLQILTKIDNVKKHSKFHDR